MRFFSIITIILLCIYLVLFLFVLKKHKKTVKFILYQAVISVLLLAILNLTSFLTGRYIPVNECTVLGISLGGVPMIFCFLLLKFIFVL